MKNELTTPQLLPAVKTLVETIRTEIEAGKERAYLAMEQEKRLTYWNVGKHIKEHLLQNADRADYGDNLVAQLSKELNLAFNLLYDSVRFYEQYPEILHSSAKLTWSHVRVLVHIQEKRIREAFEKKVIAEKLSVVELRKLIKRDRSVPLETAKPTLKVERGEPYIYRLKKIQKQSMIDLGFRFYIQNPFVDAQKKEAIIKTTIIKKESVGIPTEDHGNEREYKFTAADGLSVPHYTYKAYVIEVIDGDTLWVNIDLGFNSWTVQKLRLKGINAKELETKEGQSAKEYMESRLKGCKFIAIKTYWRDKFTRYLADIFYKKSEKDFISLVQNGRHLNQELLDRELAVRY